MKPYVLSPRARADLKNIWKYTEERWDTEQADRYIVNIHKAMEALATRPQRGRPCDDIRPGYRRHSVGTHMIFFRIVTDGIEVVRVLHQRMDFRRHL